MLFQEGLPLDEYFALVDEHFATRKTIARIDLELEQRAQQFRSVQKRLLVRFKVRPKDVDARQRTS